MKVRKLTSIAAAAMIAVGFATQSAAAVTTYDFGQWLNGQNVPGGNTNWGSLSINNTSGNDYTFTLSLLNNFDDIFGTGAFIGDAMFNNSAPVGTTVGPAIVAGSWGVTSVTSSNASNLASISWDFGDGFGGGSDKLKSGESVSWTQSFASSLNLVNPYVTLHVQGLAPVDGVTSGHYVPGIPEPETYAMMLVGFSLLGFVARRRKQGLGSLATA